RAPTVLAGDRLALRFAAPERWLLQGRASPRPDRLGAPVGVGTGARSGAAGDRELPAEAGVIVLSCAAPALVRKHREMVRGLVLSCVLTSVASAQTLPSVIGATEVAKVAAPAGFIDDVAAVDSQRLAYVVADGTAKAELHVLELESKQELVVDLSPVMLRPT